MDVLSLGGAGLSGYDSFVPPGVPLLDDERADQLITIVTTPVRVNRPPASFGRRPETSGTMRSW